LVYSNNDVLTYESYSEGFKFTKKVLKETLRLKTPAHVLGRSNIKKYKYKDYTFKEGTNFIIHFNQINYDKKIWGDDAAEFNPDRFDSISKDDIKFKFFPFSIGARTCIGRNFAEMEMILVLSKIVTNFELSISKDQISSVKEEISLTLKPNRILLNIKKINQ
jgi:cytochrome P450